MENMQNIANIYNNSNKNYCKEKSKNLAILIGGNGGENCLLDERFKEHLWGLDASKSDFKKNLEWIAGGSMRLCRVWQSRL